MTRPDPAPIDPATRERAIAYIIDQGLVTRPTAWQRARTVLERLGWRFVFWDLAHALIWAGLTILTTLLVVALTPDTWQYSATLAASPVIFLLIALFTEMADRASGLHQLKQTCHLTPRQILAVRVGCFSLVGSLGAGVVALLTASTLGDIATLLPLGLAVLFGCAALELSLLRWAHSVWVSAGLTIGWVGLSLALPMWLGGAWEEFLASLSGFLTALVALAGLIALIWQLSALLTRTRRHAYSH